MFIDIKEIEEDSKTFSGEISCAPIVWENKTISVTKLAYQIVLKKEKDRIYLEGLMNTVLVLNCSRCLEEYPFLIKVPFALTLVEGYLESETSEHRLDEEKIDYYPLEEGKADLKEILIEQIYLNIPLKPLCAVDCKGLCAQCGGNRNHGNCTCSAGKD